MGFLLVLGLSLALGALGELDLVEFVILLLCCKGDVLGSAGTNYRGAFGCVSEAVSEGESFCQLSCLLLPLDGDSTISLLKLDSRGRSKHKAMKSY